MHPHWAARWVLLAWVHAFTDLGARGAWAACRRVGGWGARARARRPPGPVCVGLVVWWGLGGGGGGLCCWCGPRAGRFIKAQDHDSRACSDGCCPPACYESVMYSNTHSTAQPRSGGCCPHTTAQPRSDGRQTYPDGAACAAVDRDGVLEVENAADEHVARVVPPFGVAAC